MSGIAKIRTGQYVGRPAGNLLCIEYDCEIDELSIEDHRCVVLKSERREETRKWKSDRWETAEEMRGHTCCCRLWADICEITCRPSNSTDSLFSEAVLIDRLF